MTMEQLEAHVQAAHWFANLGQHPGGNGTLPIRGLAAWGNDDETVDTYHLRIAREMEWLPGQSSDPDPVHGETLKAAAGQAGVDASLAMYKRTLESLGPLHPRPALRVGAHDFHHVARGAAAYAARTAAIEITVGQPGFWCSVIPLFSAGHWPCGLMPDNSLVIY
jgi:hypothetical protein